MSLVYLGTTNNTSFETIKKISERVMSPSVIFSNPRIIVKILMDFRYRQEAYSYYVNPSKMSKMNWNYIKNIAENKGINKVSLYLAEKTDIHHQRIPKLEQHLR